MYQYLITGSLMFATLLVSIPSNADNAPGDPVKIVIDPTTVVSAIPTDFIGLGYETAAVAQPSFFSGENEKMIRLYRNLSEDGLIRIGGNVSDHTLYHPDAPAMPESQDGVTIINRQSLFDLGDFARAAGWKVMWGLNAETDSVDNGVIEALAVDRALGDRLQSFEIGNEVQAHSQFGGSFDSYYAFYQSYKAALRAAIPNAPISGPDSIGGADWVDRFASAEGTDVRLLTCHYYRSGAPKPDATLETLLKTDDGFVTKLQQLQAVSLKSGVPYRINEMNSFWGGGKAGVSDTFGSALWALDTMYLMASNGCGGINLETDVNQLGWISHYSPIVHDSSGIADVRPEYYGMLAFSLTGKGDLIGTTVDKDAINLTAYTTISPDGTLWLTIVNKDFTRNAMVTAPLPAGCSSASVYRLTARSVDSLEHVTLGGSEVDANGNWRPRSQEKLKIAGGALTVTVPQASAALIHIQ